MTEAGERPLRLFMTADAVGGVWHYAATLAEQFARPRAPLRAEITLAVLGPCPSPIQREQLAQLGNLQFFWGDFPLEWMPASTEEIARSGRWLLDLAAAWRPDIVHLNGYAHAALSWPAPVLVVGHSCVLSWWHAVHNAPPPAKWADYERQVRRGLHSADCVVAPTAAMLRALAHHYGPLRDERVIANGCALERFRARPKEDFIFAAGRFWDEGKNLAALDRAAADLEWPVNVAGDWRHPDGSLREPKNARSLGPLAATEIADWMARAAIYAFPARYEPFGLSVLEAAASGCCLVLGDIATLRESWEGAALFVPPDDSDGLAKAIATLIADGDRRAALAAAAHRRAQNFSAARMATRYAELYRELLARHRAPFAAALTAGH